LCKLDGCLRIFQLWCGRRPPRGKCRRFEQHDKLAQIDRRFGKRDLSDGIGLFDRFPADPHQCRLGRRKMLIDGEQQPPGWLQERDGRAIFRAKIELVARNIHRLVGLKRNARRLRGRFLRVADGRLPTLAIVVVQTPGSEILLAIRLD